MKPAGEPDALKRRLKGTLVNRKVIFTFRIYFVISWFTVDAIFLTTIIYKVRIRAPRTTWFRSVRDLFSTKNQTGSRSPTQVHCKLKESQITCLITLNGSDLWRGIWGFQMRRGAPHTVKKINAKNVIDFSNFSMFFGLNGIFKLNTFK